MLKANIQSHHDEQKIQKLKMYAIEDDSIKIQDKMNESLSTGNIEKKRIVNAIGRCMYVIL